MDIHGTFGDLSGDLQGSMLLILHILLQLWLEALYLLIDLWRMIGAANILFAWVLVPHANLSLISCIGVGTVQISREMLHPCGCPRDPLLARLGWPCVQDEGGGVYTLLYLADRRAAAIQWRLAHDQSPDAWTRMLECAPWLSFCGLLHKLLHTLGDLSGDFLVNWLSLSSFPDCD